MRALAGAGLIFTGILLLITGWGAFAGILLIMAGAVVWAWGVAGSQQDESLDSGDAGIIDPNATGSSGAGGSGVVDPNEGGADPDAPQR